MKRIFGIVLPAALAAGCGKGSEQHHALVDAVGATDVFGDSEHGDFVYVGDAEHDEGGALAETFDVTATVWADHGGVNGKIEAVDWGFEYDGDPGPATNDEGGLLDLWGRSGKPHSGVDYVVAGATEMDVDLVLLDGSVELWDTRGEHVVTADGVFGGGLSGKLDLYARKYGMSLDLRPEPGDTVDLQAYGDVTLWLPYGLDIDLEVTADLDWGVAVADLGFDDAVVLPDYVHVVRGEGSIPIRVDLEGGRFTLLEAEADPEEAR